MTVTMVYPGVIVIPIFPAAWQPNSGGSTGWWYEPIIYQAWTNFQAGAKAPSDFTFVNAVPGGISLGQNGFGYLSAVVASGYPTITVAFTNGNHAAFSSWLSPPLLAKSRSASSASSRSGTPAPTRTRRALPNRAPASR